MSSRSRRRLPLVASLPASLQPPVNLDPEPRWTLRGKDRTAPTAIRRWAETAAVAGAPDAKVAGALRDAAAMEQWQRRHGSKIPD